MAKYRAYPVIVDAVQFRREREMFDFLTGTTNQPITTIGEVFRIDFSNTCTFQLGKLTIKTPEGEMVVNSGDYVVKDTNGEFRSYKADAFERMYYKIESNV